MQHQGHSGTHIIIIGNEKGGSGKTTTTMHLIVALLQLGFKVGSIDLDSRQRSLTRYLENRRQYLFQHGSQLKLPQHVVVNRSPFNVLEDAEQDERTRLNEALDHLRGDNDFIIIDCPGSDMYLSREAHSHANTIITPINDSFIDLDVLGTINPETYEVIKPSLYSEMLWEQKLLKAKRDGSTLDWVVMRNRLSNIDARNKRRMADAVARLSQRVGFRQAPGFSERVIFRELFLQGLTVLDVLQNDTTIEPSISHIAAREEVRNLLRTLQIDRVTEALQRSIRSDARNKRKEVRGSNAPKSAAPTTTQSQPSQAPAAEVNSAQPAKPINEIKATNTPSPEPTIAQPVAATVH